MPLLLVQKGHCYRTTGATGTTGEQQYATQVADACVRLLDGKNGWDVKAVLADISLDSYRADAFAAVHCDGSTNPTARGSSVGYKTPEGQRLAQAWERAYAARGWPIFRDDNYTAALKNYYGVSNAISAGCRRAFIMECGFMTNPEDRLLMTEPGGVDRVALALGDALGIQMEGDVAESRTDVTHAYRWWSFQKAEERIPAAHRAAVPELFNPQGLGEELPMVSHLLSEMGRVQAMVRMQERVSFGPAGRVTDEGRTGEVNLLARKLNKMEKDIEEIKSILLGSGGPLPGGRGSE